MIKENIEKLLNSELTNYRISKLTGIDQATLSRFKNGKTKIGDMKLDNALKLNNLWEEYKMEIVNTKFIEGFEKDMDNVVSDGVYEYTLSKITFGDGSTKYEVNLEVDGDADVFEPKYFDKEEEAREYIKNDM
ncbi:hypothetical protein [Gracilibacillus dipsosauri]|uniref:hypothetical protein n=1 Tax=Gracilibacillus dipsosauri TaxID=178340 RepID=UPI0024091E6F